MALAVLGRIVQRVQVPEWSKRGPSVREMGRESGACVALVAKGRKNNIVFSNIGFAGFLSPGKITVEVQLAGKINFAGRSGSERTRSYCPGNLAKSSAIFLLIFWRGHRCAPNARLCC